MTNNGAMGRLNKLFYSYANILFVNQSKMKIRKPICNKKISNFLMGLLAVTNGSYHKEIALMLISVLYLVTQKREN